VICWEVNHCQYLSSTVCFIGVFQHGFLHVTLRLVDCLTVVFILVLLLVKETDASWSYQKSTTTTFKIYIIVQLVYDLYAFQKRNFLVYIVAMLLLSSPPVTAVNMQLSKKSCWPHFTFSTNPEVKRNLQPIAVCLHYDYGNFQNVGSAKQKRLCCHCNKT